MSFPVCKFFKSEQGCKFGNKCRYKHSDPLDLPAFNQSTHHQNQNDGSVRKSYSSQTSALSQEHLTASGEYEASVRNPRILHTDHLTGYYSYTVPGNNEDPLRFAPSFRTAETHLEKKFQELEATYHNEEAVTSNVHPAFQQRSHRKLCHYFARSGNCCFGSKCRFEHAQPHKIPHTQPCQISPRFQQDRGGSRSWATENWTDGYQLSMSQDGKTEEGKGVRHSWYSQNQRGFSSYPGGNPFPRTGPATFVSADKSAQNGSPADRLTQSGPGQEGTENINEKNQNIKSDKICQFFVRGRCWKGRRCRFLHPRHQAQSPKPVVVGEQGETESNTKNEDKSSTSLAQSQKEETVKFSPSTSAEGTHTESVSSSKPSVMRKPRTPHVAQGTRKYRREEVDDVEGSRLRRTEIEQLVKRFPKSKMKVNRDCAEYFQCIISFNPTDPDWPFDVKVFQLQVDIPSDYPFEMLSVTLPTEQDLPETVRRYLEVSTEEWLEEKERQLADSGQVELVFRPFLRWLDRSIEDVVTEGLRQLKREMVAKAAGLEFVSAKQLQKQYPGQNANSYDDGDNEDDDGSDDEDETASESQDEDTSSDYDESDEEESCEERVDEDEDGRKKGRKSQQDKAKLMMAEPDRKGTEVTLKNLQLKESAATLFFEKMCLLIQCERCKATSEFMASPGRVNMVQCSQCSQTQMATYRPAMVHHFSSVIGYLDLDACLPYDVILQNCSAVISCLNCSKDTKAGVVAPGQPQDHWCRVCHHKLRIATDGVRFTQLEPSTTIQSLKGSVKVVVPTRKRIPKDPAIQEGKPLPNFGTCKHYKKSYRWMRFPCCGKCYPCDICHDSKEDHEMKFANRMICGFCCKEQMYAAERPCKGCDMNMTKVHTKHWEGGQGCRDKISMSRNDKQKHRNVSKTVSKHSQKVKDMQSKKRTKLRHT